MWEPVGPLPAAVYWRRRCSAAVATVAVLGLLTWTGRSASPPARRHHHPRGQPRRSLRSPARRPAPGVSPDTDVTAGGGVRAGEQPGSAVARGARRRPRRTARGRGRAPATRRHAPRAPLPARRRSRCPPTGPVPCADDMIGVAAEIDPGRAPGRASADAAAGRDQHQRAAVRARPRLGPPGDRGLEPGRADGSGRATTASTAPPPTCARWCPGQPVAFAVAWAGRTSAPGCARRPRPWCRPATTGCMSRVDDVISGPTEFRRLP